VPSARTIVLSPPFIRGSARSMTARKQAGNTTTCCPSSFVMSGVT
jgi:hypothetical protein